MRLAFPVAMLAILAGCAMRPSSEPARAAAVPDASVEREAVARCEALAAMPDDPSRPGSDGISFDSIDVVPARAACEAAFRADPEEARVAFHLSRVLRRQEDPLWQDLLLKAADAGLPAASYVLGLDMVGSAWDLPQGRWGTDYRQARRYLTRAVDAGFVDAIYDVMPLVWLGVDGSAPDRREAERLLDMLEQHDRLGARNLRAWTWALHRIDLRKALAMAHRNILEAAPPGDRESMDRLASFTDTKARVLLELRSFRAAEKTEREALRLAEKAGTEHRCFQLQLGLILQRANKPKQAQAVWSEVALRMKDAKVRRASLAGCPEFFRGPFAIPWLADYRS